MSTATEADLALLCQQAGPLIGCSPRRVRLLGVACVRQVWDWLDDRRSRQAVRLAESLADAWGAGVDPDNRKEHIIESATAAYYSAAKRNENITFPQMALDVLENGHRLEVVARMLDELNDPAIACALLRDIGVGPALAQTPFSAESVRLATAAYLGRKEQGGRIDPVRLAVLCDCLEEEGLEYSAPVRHLRDESLTHVRGCWALDHILSRWHY